MKPGLTTEIFLLIYHFFLNVQIRIFAKSFGVFLFIFDKTIATFVDISLLNLDGGISTLIPLSLLGNLIGHHFFDSNRYVKFFNFI